MASLQSRVASRGFPVFDTSGQSGQGALPDSTRPGPGRTPGTPVSGWTDPHVDPGSVAATLPMPEEYVVLGPMMWGLPAEAKPDNTPRTHAAPIADPSLAWQYGAQKNSTGIEEYNAELEAAHEPTFNGVEIRHHPGIQGRRRYTHQDTPGSPPGPLQPLDGQIRSMAGKDGVQGYGSLGGGVNGTNEFMPLTVVDRQFAGETYTNVFLTAAEVPLISPNADQFIPTQAGAPEFGPWPLGGNFDVPTASAHAQDIVSADVPAQGPPVPQGPALLPLWGSF